MLAMNMTFYPTLILLTWLQDNSQRKNDGVVLPISYPLICRVFAASLLIASLAIIRFRAKSLAYSRRTMRENIITIHTILFLLEICTQIAYWISCRIITNYEEPGQSITIDKEYRLILACYLISSLHLLVNIAILSLYFYIFLKIGQNLSITGKSRVH